MASLEHLEGEARNAGITCLYGVLDPSRRRGERPGAGSWMAVRGEAAVLFDLPQEWPRLGEAQGVTVKAGTPDDVPVLEPLAAAHGAVEPFAVDPRFGLPAPSACSRPGSIAARATTRAALADGRRGRRRSWPSSGTCTNLPRIDAVGTTKKGSGAATNLMQLALDDVVGGTLVAGPIAARNVASMRYVFRSGFRPVRWSTSTIAGSTRSRHR